MASISGINLCSEGKKMIEDFLGSKNTKSKMWTAFLFDIGTDEKNRKFIKPHHLKYPDDFKTPKDSEESYPPQPDDPFEYVREKLMGMHFGYALFLYSPSEDKEKQPAYVYWSDDDSVRVKDKLIYSTASAVMLGYIKQRCKIIINCNDASDFTKEILSSKYAKQYAV